MVPELRGREAETSCGQECEAHGQWGPEEDSGIRKHTYPTLGGGCGEVFLLFIVVRAGPRPLTAAPQVTPGISAAQGLWQSLALPSLLLARPVLGWVRPEDRGAGTWADYAPAQIVPSSRCLGLLCRFPCPRWGHCPAFSIPFSPSLPSFSFPP